MKHSPVGGVRPGKSFGRIHVWVSGPTRPEVRSAQNGQSAAPSRRCMRPGACAVYSLHRLFHTRRSAGTPAARSGCVMRTSLSVVVVAIRLYHGWREPFPPDGMCLAQQAPSASDASQGSRTGGLAYPAHPPTTSFPCDYRHKYPRVTHYDHQNRVVTQHPFGGATGTGASKDNLRLWQ